MKKEEYALEKAFNQFLFQQSDRIKSLNKLDLFWWTHNENEIPRISENALVKMGVNRNWIRTCYRNIGARLKALGVRAGYPDQFYMWGDKNNQNFGFIEWKVKSKTLRGEQRNFQKMCQENNINHGVATNSEEAIEILKAWGIVI